MSSFNLHRRNLVSSGVLLLFPHRFPSFIGCPLSFDGILGVCFQCVFRPTHCPVSTPTPSLFRSRTLFWLRKADLAVALLNSIILWSLFHLCSCLLPSYSSVSGLNSLKEGLLSTRVLYPSRLFVLIRLEFFFSLPQSRVILPLSLKRRRRNLVVRAVPLWSLSRTKCCPGSHFLFLFTLEPALPWSGQRSAGHSIACPRSIVYQDPWYQFSFSTSLFLGSLPLQPPNCTLENACFVLPRVQKAVLLPTVFDFYCSPPLTQPLCVVFPCVQRVFFPIATPAPRSQRTENRQDVCPLPDSVTIRNSCPPNLLYLVSWWHWLTPSLPLSDGTQRFARTCLLPFAPSGARFS